MAGSMTLSCALSPLLGVAKGFLLGAIFPCFLVPFTCFLILFFFASVEHTGGAGKGLMEGLPSRRWDLRLCWRPPLFSIGILRGGGVGAFIGRRSARQRSLRRSLRHELDGQIFGCLIKPCVVGALNLAFNGIPPLRQLRAVTAQEQRALCLVSASRTNRL